jgi:tetratricopeptide (TPR) repeat protein
MLKSRLGNWGVGRNLREGDIVEALRIAFQREAREGKKTDFVIRNKTVTRRDIARYLGRKGIRDFRDFVDKSTKRGDPSLIHPYTPPPTRPVSPVVVDPFSFCDEIVLAGTTRSHPDDFLHFFCSRSSSENAFAFSQISTPLADPPELELLHDALLSNDLYIRSIFPNHYPPGDSPPFEGGSDDLSDFTNGMWRGRDLLIEQEYKEAFKHFNKAFVAVQSLLETNHRGFLPEFFEMLLNFQLEEQVDILQSLLQFITHMSVSNGGLQNLVSRITMPLLQMNRQTRLEAVERLMNNVLENFQSNIGQDHPESKSIQKALTRSLVRRKPLSKAIFHLESLLEYDQAIPSMPHYDRCNVLVELALCHRAQYRLDDAAQWIATAWQAADGLESLFHQADIRVRCLRLMSYIEKKKENWQAAYDLAKRAVSISTVGMGETDSLTALVRDEFTTIKAQACEAGVAILDLDTGLNVD